MTQPATRTPGGGGEGGAGESRDVGPEGAAPPHPKWRWRDLPRPAQWPLSAKIAAVLLTAVLLPTAISAWINLRSSVSQLEGEGYSRLELLGRSLGDRIDEMLRADRQGVLLLASDPEVVALLSAPAAERAGAGSAAVRALRQSADRSLHNLVGAAGQGYAEAYLLDPDGDAVLTTNPDHLSLPPGSFKRRDYFSKALKGEPYVSQVLIGHTTRRPGVYFSAPVAAPDGTVAGVAVVKLDGAALLMALDGLPVGEGGAAYLLDEDRIVVAHTDRSRLFHSLGPLGADEVRRINPQLRFQTDSIPSLRLAQLVGPVSQTQQGGKGAADTDHVVYTDAGGTRRIVGLARLRQRRWVVGVDVPSGQFTAPLERLARRHGWTVALVSAVMVALALVMGRRLVKPVDRLVAAAARLETGDFAGAKIDRVPGGDLGRLVLAFNAMAGHLRERERERDVFGRFVSPEVREQLLAGEVKLGGQTRYVSILFSDIRGFSTLSEKMAPQQVVAFLNEFLTEMTGAVRPWGGYVNNFLGDAVLVVFGAPARQEDCEGRAVAAALSMREALARLNGRRAARGEEPLESGIGIGSGEVVAGQVGSLERLMYTVIGDAVNVAARLESLTRDYPAYPVLVNGTTAAALDGREFTFERIGPVRVKGRTEPVEVCAVTGRK